MIRDNTADQAFAVALAPAALNADTTSSSVDLLGADSATVAISVGVGGITFDANNKIEFKLSHSDDDVTYTACDAGDVVLGTNADAAVGAGGIVRSLVAAHAAPSVAEVGYIGAKRFVKVQADFSGTHGSATGIGVNVVKSRLHIQGNA